MSTWQIARPQQVMALMRPESTDVYQSSQSRINICVWLRCQKKSTHAYTGRCPYGYSASFYGSFIEPSTRKNKNKNIYNQLNTPWTTETPAPPKFSIGDYQSHPMKSWKPASVSSAGFFVSVVFRGHPAESGDYWYTVLGNTSYRMPKTVYQFTQERPQWHGQPAPWLTRWTFPDWPWPHKTTRRIGNPAPHHFTSKWNFPVGCDRRTYWV